MAKKVSKVPLVRPRTLLCGLNCHADIKTLEYEVLGALQPFISLESSKELLDNHDTAIAMRKQLITFGEKYSVFEEEIRVFNHQYDEETPPPMPHLVCYENFNLLSYMNAVTMKLAALDTTIVRHRNNVVPPQDIEDFHIHYYTVETQRAVGLIFMHKNLNRGLHDRASWVFPSHLFH